MRRQGLKLLVLGMVALLSATLAVVFLGHGPDTNRTPGRAVLGAATTTAVENCREVLLVGVDGAGEAPRDGATFGDTVQVFARAYLKRAAAAGRSVDVKRVPFASRSVASLVRAGGWDLPGRKAVSASTARDWRDGTGDAYKKAIAVLDSAATACPEQQVVLVGYAQGASVVHRVLLTLQQRSGGLSRVAGAALISDPDRVANSVADKTVGAPAASRRTPGIFPVVLAPIADVPSSTATLQVWNVCTFGDLVCNPNLTIAKQAVPLARSYRSGDGATAVRAAAAGAWSRTALWPVPRPRVQVMSARTGEPVSLQLQADVATSAGTGVRWGNPTDLPPGLTLSATGLISGSPKQTGTWNLGYQVSNTTPSTTGSTGVVVVTVAPATAAVNAGGQATCETRSDGSLRCWGRNSFGQLGDGSTTTRSTPTTVSGGGTWRSVSTSGASTCAIRTDRTLWCWGLDNYAQLGIGTGSPRLTPVQVGTATTWASVSTSWFHTCALRTDGTLWCWGQNLRGQLGDGTYTLRGRPTQIGTAKNWTNISTGGFHTCGTRADGSMWCWGQNIFGQLGNSNLTPQPSPVRVAPARTWSDVSAGWGHTCAVTTAGAASCWGLNNRGQLGDGTRTMRTSPVTVLGSHVWTSISAADSSTCAVDNTGTAYCWGSNRYGMLGDGSGQPQVSPSPVQHAAGWLSADTGWFHGCGTLPTGSTACWGNNEMGQLGNGTVVDLNIPQETSP